MEHKQASKCVQSVPAILCQAARYSFCSESDSVCDPSCSRGRATQFLGPIDASTPNQVDNTSSGTYADDIGDRTGNSGSPNYRF
jgi:hypothetical protein